MPYNTADAAHPELYGRLLEERYGPLALLLAERAHHPLPPAVRKSRARPWRLRPVSPEQAAKNYADLANAIGAPLFHDPRNQAA